jgi:hypothetical protein
MAHKSREPERSVRGKMTRPRDRGEKYVGPQILPGEDSGSAWSNDAVADGETVGQALRRRRLERHGSAHELIQKLDDAILRELAGSRRGSA